MTYIAGDFWRLCDVCGFKYRASQTRRRWDNLMVCDADWEPRHPQDFVRGRKDRQSVSDARPESVDAFIGALTTTTSAAATAGTTTINVVSSVRFAADDDIRITLDNGEVHRATVETVPDSVSFTLTAGLPGAVASGALVVNYSAVSAPNIG